MTQELYYTPPSDEVFNEVKEACIQLWKEVDSDNDKYGYATSKIDRIKDIDNISDNLMYMVAMFDSVNKMHLLRKLSAPAASEIINRIV